MAILLATIITSFIIAFLTIPVFIKFSLKKNLVDIPGRRKIHKKVTPSMGGIAIFLGFFFASLIWVEFQYWKDIKFILVSLFVIFFIGVRDDLVPLRAYIKLIGQILVAIMIMVLMDLRIQSFGGLFGLYELPDFVSYIITVFTIIIITNSFNLIDGLDGLAGTIASIAFFAFGTWFYLTGSEIYATLCFAMLGGVLAFLIFNWEPSEVFMGDTGALLIGMMLSILAIHFINANDNLPVSSSYKFMGSISTAICIIIIPLIDTLRIILLRLYKRKSPFSPDKSHIHHAIMRLGFTHSKTTLTLGGFHAFFILLAIICKDMKDSVLLLGVGILTLGFSVILDRLILKKLDGEIEQN